MRKRKHHFQKRRDSKAYFKLVREKMSAQKDLPRRETFSNAFFSMPRIDHSDEVPSRVCSKQKEVVSDVGVHPKTHYEHISTYKMYRDDPYRQYDESELKSTNIS